MKISKKSIGFKLRLKTVDGGNGTYLFIKDPAGSYHAFIEVATKGALRDCGVKGKGNIRHLAGRLLGF